MGPGARIDLSALRHNLQRVREAAPASRIFAVIKANAYGHGMLRVARALADADALAVARVEEAVALREAGVSKDLLVLEGCIDRDELELALVHRLQVAVQGRGQLEMISRHPDAGSLACWLKVDSGMHRLGFQIGDVPAALERLQTSGVMSDRVRLITHLANGDDLDDPKTASQLSLFRPLVERYQAESSIGNSAGILGWPDTRSDWIRPGIMLYGSSPFLNGRPEQHDLRPVMTFESRLIARNLYARGTPIGYGGTWICPEEMPVGVVAVGYGDGYPRHAPSGTPLLLNGRRVPLIGRVSMDMVSVDLRSQPDARVGDPVTLWGEGLPAEEIAELSGTITYELFCGVTGRVRFYEAG